MKIYFCSFFFFFFKQKTAYEMLSGDWSSDVCSSDLPNLLNQYTSRTVPAFVNVLGAANSNATVTVNNQPTSRKGEYFRSELNVDNTASPLWLSLTNLAVLNNCTNADIVTNITGNAFLPQTPEAFGYDADGNMTN